MILSRSFFNYFTLIFRVYFLIIADIVKIMCTALRICSKSSLMKGKKCTVGKCVARRNVQPCLDAININLDENNE